LSAQEWRGNIRELRNVLEQSAMCSDNQRIDAALLRQVLLQSGVDPRLVARANRLAANAALPAGQDADLLRPMAEQVAEVERQAITAAMRATDGNKMATARLLGISRATLYQRLSEIDTFD
ncbi:MAG: AAA family ATPase, partial [Rhodoferax sp.]|nr:AAA family ATPase [Rhodoferax sp.]